jgi:hypothetical protein
MNTNPIPVRDRTPSPSEWISAQEARGILRDTSASVLHRVAVLGLIRVKLEPGRTPRYHRGDCERYERSMPPKRHRTPAIPRAKTKTRSGDVSSK